MHVNQSGHAASSSSTLASSLGNPSSLHQVSCGSRHSRRQSPAPQLHHFQPSAPSRKCSKLQAPGPAPCLDLWDPSTTVSLHHLCTSPHHFSIRATTAQRRRCTCSKNVRAAAMETATRGQSTRATNQIHTDLQQNLTVSHRTSHWNSHPPSVHLLENAKQ